MNILETPINDANKLVQTVLVNENVPAVTTVEGQTPVRYDPERVKEFGIHAIKKSLVSEKFVSHHDSNKLAEVIMYWFARARAPALLGGIVFLLVRRECRSRLYCLRQEPIEEKRVTAKVLDEAELKENFGRAMGQIPNGVYVLTLERNGSRDGLLSTWLSQAAFEPPLISIAIKAGRRILSALLKITCLS